MTLGPAFARRQVFGVRPAQRTTGRRGYFGKRASVTLSRHSTNVEPRADVTDCA